RKSVIINIVYPPTTPAFSHPSFPEGGEWRYHRPVKLPPNLKKNLHNEKISITLSFILITS
ncbi:hypothetical protein, partial [Bacteroides sp. 43_46]|uniref:hypothetical protein n=1 Tax=Bacteroides sp. 43_46 TaxID=1897051 RepID=UPI00257D4515